MANAKKRCRYCKEWKPVEAMLKVPLGAFCNVDHAYKYAAEKSQAKRTKEVKRDIRQKKAELKLGNVRHQHRLTQQAFNRLRVLQELSWFKDRGIEPYCISCGKENMDWCCGHFKTVGSSGSLRYDVKNTYLQCNFYCNMNKSGNIEGCSKTHGYKQGLLLRFGNTEGQSIIDYCLTSQSNVKKWDGVELQGKRKGYRLGIKELESEV